MKKQKQIPSKFENSIKAMEHALTFSKQANQDPFYFSGISKSFETCLEYAWKHFKQKAQEEGLEAYSPKDAIRQAGRLHLIDNVEKWLDFLEDRNLAVHDYLGISNEEYFDTIKEFLIEVKKLTK